jgi:hypothetical protein
MSKRTFYVGWVIVLLAPFLISQSTPRVTGVEPVAGKVGDNLTITGENLDEGSVAGALLSDTEKDYPAEVVAQEAAKIVIKVPEVKAGDYNVALKVGDAILIQPMRFKVE